jgi:hypothetical protein
MKSREDSYKISFIFFAILFVLLFFHKLRDASSIYLVALVIVFIITLLMKLKRNIYSYNKYFFLYILFIYYLFYIGFISVFSLSTKELLATWPRLILTPTLGFIAPLFIDSNLKLRRLIGIYLGLSVFFCLSIYFQMIIGPISWFADSASRGGLTRFSSLYGNVTAIGISGSLALIVLIYYKMNKLLKFICGIIIVTSLLLSLQKAAIMGIVVCIFIYIFSSFNIKKLFFFLLLNIFMYLLISNSPTLIKDYINVSLVNTFGFTPFAKDVEVYSLSTETELKGRLMEHPGEVYDVVGDYGILIGGGILGGGGAFGIESAQAHNSFFDLLFSGGVLFLVFYLFILYELLRYYYLKKSSLNEIEANNSLVIFYFLFLYLIHMPFNSGGVFHPNHSILFWISLGILTNNNFINNSNHEKKYSTLQ